MDWSYRLLGVRESRVLRGLSVLPGGCSYGTAERVTGTDPDVLESLIDKNLLRRRPGSDRYWMLTTIREYAGEQLAAAGEEPGLVLAATLALTDMMVDIGRRVESDGAALEEYAPEEPNVQHLVDASLRLAYADEALELAGVAATVQRDAGRIRQALSMTERTLAAAPDAPGRLRAKALNGRCLAFHGIGEYARASECAAEARRLAAESGAAEIELMALGNLVAQAVEMGEHSAAKSYLDETMDLARALGDETELARANFNLGEMLVFDDPAAAVEPLEIALEIVRRTGNEVGEIFCLTRLGGAHWRLGRPADGCRLLTECLRLAAQSRRSFFAPESLDELAAAAVDLDEIEAGRAFAAGSAGLRATLRLEALQRAADPRRAHLGCARDRRRRPVHRGGAVARSMRGLADALTERLTAADRGKGGAAARAHDGPVG